MKQGDWFWGHMSDADESPTLHVMKSTKHPILGPVEAVCGAKFPEWEIWNGHDGGIGCVACLASPEALGTGGLHDGS